MVTKRNFDSQTSSIRLRTIGMFVAAAAAIVGTTAKAHADCVTVHNLTDGPPYAEFDLENKCHGGAIVHWTRQRNNTTETGTWFAAGCQTTHEQYFSGKYTTGSVEFPRGGDGDLCISMKDQGKAEEKVDKKSPSPTSSRISPQGSAVPVDSPLARAREAAKKKAEGAEQKNEAAAKDVKNIYKEKVDELQALKAKQAAEEQAVRQNQEKIRQQVEREKDNTQTLTPKLVQSGGMGQSHYCWDSHETCMKAWGRTRNIIDRYYGNTGRPICTFYHTNMPCFFGPNGLDFNN